MKIRCFTKKDKNLWVAMSLEFGLSAQSQDCGEAVYKLKKQIEDHVDFTETLNSEINVVNMINRKSPAYFYFKYYWIALKENIKCIPTEEYIFDVEVNLYEPKIQE